MGWITPTPSKKLCFLGEVIRAVLGYSNFERELRDDLARDRVGNREGIENRRN